MMICDEATVSQMIHLEAKVNANATTDMIRFVPVFLSYEIGFCSTLRGNPKPGKEAAPDSGENLDRLGLRSACSGPDGG